MSQINAVYRQGVFQPLEPVNFDEEQHVRLSIEPASKQTPQQWLDEIKSLQSPVISRQGVLPDSTGDIAADRLR